MIGNIFKAYDVRATYPDPLNELAAFKVGLAAARFFREQAGIGPNRPMVRDGSIANTLLVSRDMRPSSPPLCQALIEGIRAGAMNVIDLGMCDTSFMYFAINHLRAAGGIQTTASHNPIQYNGFKVSGKEARPIGAATGLDDIRQIAQGLSDQKPENLAGKLAQRDLWPEYRRHVRQFLCELKRPLKVVIDAANGMAGAMIPKVFADVKNLTIVPLNFEITGSFVHEPNPLLPENMRPTQQAVVAEQADLGVSFDGDADRCILCDEQGQIVGCDHLTALLAQYYLNQSPGSAVVYDLRSSKVVEETVRKLHGQAQRSRVGHVFLKQALRQMDGVFGGELSGHFYFRDNFYADSGAIAMASVLSLLGMFRTPLSELIGPFRAYPQSGEINYHVEDKEGVFQGLKEQFAGKAKIDELDGVTVDAWERSDGGMGGWWFNVRASNTEPLMRLNAEARTAEQLAGLLARVQPLLGEPVTQHH